MAWEAFDNHLRTSAPRAFLRRNRLRVGIALSMLALLIGAMSAAGVYRSFGQARQPAPASRAQDAAYYGADDGSVQGATNNAGWPQQQANWCAIATISAVAHFRNHNVSQNDIAGFLNTNTSEWGTAPKSYYLNPPFAADIAQDTGTDPRAIAAGLDFAAQSQESYHQLVSFSNALDATRSLASDLIRTHEPISVVILHGEHQVLVSGMYATDNPAVNPWSIQSLVVWDPGNPANGSNLLPARRNIISLTSWLGDSRLWGAPYDANPLPGFNPPNYLDPDPSVGPFRYNDPANGYTTHLWIGHYVYLRPDDPGEPMASVNADWPMNQLNELIEGWQGEKPAGYTGRLYIVSLPGKSVLADRSIDAPTLWSAASTPLPAGAPATVLAWVGTDDAHHLNLMTASSSDGLNFGNKITLGDTSLQHPGVVVSQGSNGQAVISIAWVGMDDRHSLNVMYDVYGAQKKVTLWDTSPFTPTLAAYNGHLWLGWAGTDPNHSLNVMDMGPQGVTAGAKTTLWSFQTNASPTFVTDTDTNGNLKQLLLTWEDHASTHLNLAQSTDGVTWGSPYVSWQTSPFQPGFAQLDPTPSGMQPYYWTWTGTDDAHSINAMVGSSLTNWQSPITLADTSPYGSALGYAPGHPNTIVLAWTGTDADHHMNIATLPV